MSKKIIKLFAESPVKVNGKRCFHKEFTVDSQEQADALVKCGAASVVTSDDADKAAADKAAADKAAADKAAADKAAAASKTSKADAK